MSFQSMLDFSGTAEAQTVAVAGAADEAVLDAVALAQGWGVRFLLIGNPQAVRALAKERNLALGSCEFITAEDEASVCAAAVSACATGEAGVLMKGLVQTGTFTRAILDKRLRLTPEGALLSHVAFFEHPLGGKPFGLTDAAINIAPDLDAKKRILANAVDTIRALGVVSPKIALVAPVEKINEKIPSTVDAVALKDWVARGALGDCLADGPFGLDVALSRDAAETKGLDSPVSGDADLLLAANLDAGNVLYKSIVYFTKVRHGGILAGARVPVVLTSRADSSRAKADSLRLALAVSQGLS